METDSARPHKSGTENEGGTESRKKGDGFIASLTKSWLPFLTALLVLMTAALGLLAARTKEVADERDVAQDSSSTLAEKNEQLAAEVAQLEADKVALESELAGLRNEADTPGTPTTTTRNQEPDVLRRTEVAPVEVGHGFRIDLDSSELNWGISSSSGDIGLSLSSMAVTGGSGVEFALVDVAPTYDQCLAQTVLKTYVDSAATVVDQKLCVHTDQDRWAYVRIAGLDREAGTMSLDVLVWKLPTDP